VFTDLILYLSNGISLPGHFLDWLLFWFWTLSTITILIRYRKLRGVRIYGIVLIIFIVLTMIPMMIPFIGIYVFAFEPDEKRYRISETVEVTEHSVSAVSGSRLVCVKSSVFYEQMIGETKVRFDVW
jgi:hypothetical protein